MSAEAPQIDAQRRNQRPRSRLSRAPSPRPSPMKHRSFFRGRQPVPEISRLLPAGRPRPAQDRQEIHHDDPQPHSRRRDDREAMENCLTNLRPTYGNNTLRITTRQTIQFHGVLKNNLRARHSRHQRISALDARGLRRREPQRPRAADARLHESARTGFCRLRKKSRWRSRQKRKRIIQSGLTACN